MVVGKQTEPTIYKIKLKTVQRAHATSNLNVCISERERGRERAQLIEFVLSTLRKRIVLYTELHLKQSENTPTGTYLIDKVPPQLSLYNLCFCTIKAQIHIRIYIMYTHTHVKICLYVCACVSD